MLRAQEFIQSLRKRERGSKGERKEWEKGEGGWRNRGRRKGNSELGLLQGELKMGSFFRPGFRHGLLERSKS